MKPTFSIFEVCSRPNGAWADTIHSGDDYAIALSLFRSHSFKGPGHGIITAPEVVLVKTIPSGPKASRTTIGRALFETVQGRSTRTVLLEPPAKP